MSLVFWGYLHPFFYYLGELFQLKKIKVLLHYDFLTWILAFIAEFKENNVPVFLG